uniref:Gp25 n=1 Tax=uncultured marine virus TaxID=186617 RepID=A0A0F7LA54_9VIRU|nr:gp25 [uncultured marine virus]
MPLVYLGNGESKGPEGPEDLIKIKQLGRNQQQKCGECQRPLRAYQQSGPPDIAHGNHLRWSRWKERLTQHNQQLRVGTRGQQGWSCRSHNRSAHQ